LRQGLTGEGQRHGGCSHNNQTFHLVSPLVPPTFCPNGNAPGLFLETRPRDRRIFPKPNSTMCVGKPLNEHRRKSCLCLLFRSLSGFPS
jgi:hypothetical protein